MIEPVNNTINTYEPTQLKSNELQDSFLTMLIAQIQHQNPLDPIDNTEFTSQLAQINTVEQLQGVNKNLGYLQLYMASINNSQALGFIGKEVLATGNSIYWDGETPASINYDLNADSTNVVVNVYDMNNHLVDTIHCGGQVKGTHNVTWHGTYMDGEAASEGTYKFQVMATDIEGNSVKVTTMLSGTVDGIAFDDGVSYVTVGGQRIPIGDIIEIRDIDSTPVTEEAEDEDESFIEDIIETAQVLGKAAIKVIPLLL